MHTLVSLQPLAAFGSGQLPGLLIPIAGIILAGVIVVSGMYFSHRRRELWHATARLALEKGQPLPPLDDEPARPRTPEETGCNLAQHDVRGGLVLLAVGVGLWMFLGELDGRLRFVGAIPAFIGVALLLYATGRALFGRKPGPRSDLPGRS